MSNNSKTSHFLIGLPGSGKSTFASTLAPKINAIIVSTDATRAKLYGDESIQGIWSELETEIINTITQAIQDNQPVIYDATNYKQEFRVDMLKKLAHLNQNWIAWYINTPIDICKERNKMRSRQVPEIIIDAMAVSLANFPPTKEEEFMEIKIL